MPRKPPEQPGVKDFNEGVYHRPPRGMSFAKTGVIALILILAFSWVAFTKSIPFTGGGYEASAVFENSATLRFDSPVRIAGVNVGKVTSIEGNGETSKVNFTVDEEGLPLKTDATIKIRPRLFLEGNFFLDLDPGSPSAPELPDGGTIPITRTSVAVQLDEVLTALQRDDRENLKILLDGYGSALADEPTTEQDQGQDPDVQGQSAAGAINDSFVYGGRAGRSTSQVSQAFLGSDPGDLQRLIDNSGELFAKLNQNETALKDLITNFSITAGALATESANVSATLRELAPTVEQAEPSLIQLNEVFPPLRTFAREAIPGVRQLPATIDAGLPWLRQTRPLLAEAELGGLARLLRSATPELARGTVSLSRLLPQLNRFSGCVSDVLVPAGDVVIDDPFSTGESNWKDFFYSAVSQAGEGGDFDGNGQFLRVQPGGGPIRVETPNPGGGFNNDVLYGNNIKAPQGTQPIPPADDPPIRTDVNCMDNPVPDINGPAAAPGPPSPAAVTP